MNVEKSILITGCSSGIGLAVAHGLKKRGYRVIASARQLADVTTLQQAGFEACQLDLDHSDSIRTSVDWLLQQTGGTLYALFNNGAYGQPGAVEDLSRDVLRQQFETNLFGTLELTNLLIPVMRRQGYGRIIQNSSVLGLITMKYRGAYNASKFAVTGFTQAVMLDLREHGVKCTVVMPGSVSSHFNDNEPGAQDEWKIQPEDIGAMIVWLLETPARTLPSKIEVRPSRTRPA